MPAEHKDQRPELSSLLSLARGLPAKSDLTVADLSSGVCHEPGQHLMR